MNSSDFTAESKPTSFPKIKQNAISAFNLDQIPMAGGKIRYQNKPDSFIIYLKNNPEIKSTRERYDARFTNDEAEEVIKERFLEKLKQQSPRRYGNLTVDDLEVERYTENQPRVKDGQLQPNIVRGNLQRIRDYGATYRDQNNVFQIEKIKASGGLTVNTVLQQIKDQSDRTKYPYYSTVLGHLIRTKDQGFKPTVLVDNLAAMNKAGLTITELLTDFGEVAGPVGLLCKSINGNAVRVLSKFLGEDNTDELMREAVIHFHASQGHMLVDSYIEFRGRVLRCSSKNAFEELSGGSGASPDGLFQSLEEIADMPEAKRAFEQLIRTNPKYASAMEQLRIVAKSFDAHEANADMLGGTLVQFDLLKQLSEHGNSGINITDSDRAILQQIYALDTSQTGMHRQKARIGAALGSTVDIDSIDAVMQQFSPAFKQLMRTFNINRYGEPGLSGVEKIKASDDKNKNRGWWLRLKKALVYNVAKIINTTPEFSTLCTWILNHGAFCQIDIRHETQGEKNNKALIINNVTATWPSTVVDRVKLMPLPSGDSFRYKLEINGNRGFDPTTYAKMLDADDSLDYDFGFATRDEQRAAMTPNERDLAKKSADWRTETMGNVTRALGIDNSESGTKKDSVPTQDRDMIVKDKRTNRGRGSRAAAEMTKLFAYFKDSNMIANMPEGFPTRDSDPSSAYITIAQLVKNIVDGYTPYNLINAIKITMKNLHFMDDVTTVRENEDDEDDDVDDSPVTPQNKAQAVQFSTYAKNMLYALYYAAQFDAAIKNNNITDVKKYKELVQRGITAIAPSTWTNIKSVVDSRVAGNPPQFNVDSSPPIDTTAPAQRERTPRSPAVPENSAVAMMQEFLRTHNIIEQSGRDTLRAAERFAIQILRGDHDARVIKIAQDFKTLLNAPAVVALIKRETIDTIQHPETVLREAALNPETTKQAVTIIYWAVTIKGYHEAAKQDESILLNPAYSQVLNTVKKYGELSIADRNTKRAFDSVINSLQSQLSNLNRSRQSAAPSQQQIVNMLNQIRTAIGAQKFTEYRADIQDELENGTPVDTIINDYKTLEESRSAILRGLLQ